MGYSFTFDKPHDGVAVDCAFNGYQMNFVRLIMIEAGAIAGDGFTAAIHNPGLETCADTVPAMNFLSNDGWHITAHEAAFIASRLRQAVELRVVPDLLSFFDDRPGAADVRDWVEEFAAFNERAARRDGYYVC
ncbi:hypothetical protein [Catellatospora tritici]|uniref:hypothetical protein n=1 Tax=Catellatospora tritici TaxID=2851566 RepID=UPI001C2D1DC9|nr:hypothetical protein [Catellatospora tritici]MBV1855829.1 hypothetical protein [Catellatospora tritici]